ncbi:MAG: asparagine synthase (glutamine-hydrolyzing), partial [bacterium]
MCGIAGIWTPDAAGSAPDLRALAETMARTLAHRGPDDHGAWSDTSDGVALAHRRLSIIDLSPLGAQPMISSDGRFVIVYNGEVYNFPELRAELESKGHVFRGRSDTEVLLTSFMEWGVEASIGRFVGMFAFALWDRARRELHLARDPLGIKPLYYGWAGGAFLFASEMKAICAHPGFTRELNTGAVPLYFHFGYVPSPHSIYRGIAALRPGCLLKIDPEALRRREPRLIPYWSAKDVVEKALSDPFPGAETDAARELERLLRRSVRSHMISDVPVGVFLSGGVDSSLVAALAVAESGAGVKTFTVGFEERRYNEAAEASAVARRLGTAHTEMYASSRDALDVVPRLPEMYDEPFGDSSQIPTFLVSRLTRKHVTVVLSGDGGDELFFGYGMYPSVMKAWKSSRRAPAPLRALCARALLAISPATRRLPPAALLPPARLMGRNPENLRESALRLARGWLARGFYDFYPMRL